MELRRPRLADKKSCLDMMTEFEKSQSAHDGGFWIQRILYEEWLESNQERKWGLICLKDGFLQFS